MARQPVEFHPEAIAEARTAFEWYRQRSEGAAAAFLTELDHAVENIAETPGRWPVYLQGTRRFLLRKFSFAITYVRLA